jgi:predicted acyltransferase
VLALVYWLVEMRQWRRWTFPFVVLGANTIAIYWLSSMGSKLVLRKMGVRDAIYRTFLAWPDFPELGSLAFAAAWLLFWIGIGAVMYRRGVFIKV